MFQIEDLALKLAWEELKHKTCKEAVSSVHNFLLCMTLLHVTSYNLKKVDSI
uniref:Uncharacterized protein n=1 Tax=Vombatus ursinus TaxID=29139 RepID=A0A4X2M945_VOMUR